MALGLPLASVKIQEKSHKLYFFDTTMENRNLNLVGKSSLSMGHFQQQTVTNYQRVAAWEKNMPPPEIAAEMGTPIHQKCINM